MPQGFHVDKTGPGDELFFLSEFNAPINYPYLSPYKSLQWLAERLSWEERAIGDHRTRLYSLSEEPPSARGYDAAQRHGHRKNARAYAA